MFEHDIDGLIVSTVSPCASIERLLYLRLPLTLFLKDRQITFFQDIVNVFHRIAAPSVIGLGIGNTAPYAVCADIRDLLRIPRLVSKNRDYLRIAVYIRCFEIYRQRSIRVYLLLRGVEPLLLYSQSYQMVLLPGIGHVQGQGVDQEFTLFSSSLVVFFIVFFNSYCRIIVSILIYSMLTMGSVVLSSQLFYRQSVKGINIVWAIVYGICRTSSHNPYIEWLTIDCLVGDYIHLSDGQVSICLIRSPRIILPCFRKPQILEYSPCLSVGIIRYLKKSIVVFTSPSIIYLDTYIPYIVVKCLILTGNINICIMIPCD